MEQAIIEFIDQYGYFGVFLLIAIENIFPPIPSEIILTFGGFMTTLSGMHVWGVSAAATLGSVAGAVVLYVVGRVLRAERLERLCEGRLGRAMHLKKGDVRRAGAWFLRHGGKAVFFCRFIPIVRSLISIPAGISRMKLRTFLPLTALGTLIWNTVLVLLGRMAGNAWETVNEYLSLYSVVAIVLLVAAVGWIGAVYIKKRFLRGDDDPGSR